jgi:hypothetical protein
MSGKCIDPADLIGDTIVLALDLIGFKPGQHQSIARGLRTREVEKEIQKVLDGETKKLLKQRLQGPIANDKALSSLESVGKATASAVTKDAEQKLGRWAECTWKLSPLGVWVDENQWVVYIVVPLVVAAGAGAAAYSYHVRAGDTPAEWGALLVKKHLKFKPVGSLELGVQDVKFVPSKRDVEVKFFSTVDWKPFKAQFTIGGGAHEGSLSKLSASSEVSYKGIGSASNVEFSVKTFVDYSNPALSFGGSAGAKYSFDVAKIPLTAGAEAQWKRTIDQGSSQKDEGSLLFTLSADFF